MLDETKIRALIAEAQDELSRYDALRANTLEIIATYEKRLALLGADVRKLPLPGVEQEQVKPKPTNGLTNTDIFIEVLEEALSPMSARDVWRKAMLRGAKTASATPDRVTDVVLRDLAAKGRVALAGPGLYAKKFEAQAAT